MEDEKIQLTKRVERMKQKVCSTPLFFRDVPIDIRANKPKIFKRHLNLHTLFASSKIEKLSSRSSGSSNAIKS